MNNQSRAVDGSLAKAQSFLAVSCHEDGSGKAARTGRRGLRLAVEGIDVPLRGQLDIPCSKYHAHRALMLGALAPGTTVIHGLSDAGHVRHTLSALRNLGAKIKVHDDTFIVEGGLLHPKLPEISVGSSGTTLYFLVGLASLADQPVTIVGQKYFQRRPIRPLLDALSGMGVKLSSPTGCPPIRVEPVRPTGGKVVIPGVLSQWISGLLLLAPFASGPSTILVDGEFNERTYVDLTIRMMAQFGLHVEVMDGGHRFEIEPNQRPVPTTLTLPPDIGSAAFGLAATALHPSDVVFRGLKAVRGSETDHPEAELLDIIAEMGLPMAKDPDTGDVRVSHGGIELAPIEVDCRSVPDMLPILSVLATYANGTSKFSNVAHVRLKESDRVSAMLQLNRMGGNLELIGEQLVVKGVNELIGTDLSSFNDHRVLMALAIAATRAKGSTRLTYPHAYRISYPRFLNEMNGIGTKMLVDPVSQMKKSAPISEAGEWRKMNVTRISQTSIVDRLHRWAEEQPDQIALVDVDPDSQMDRAWTWSELERNSDALAAMLSEMGVSPGEPVAYQMPNCAEFVALSMAILKVGGICCPIIPIFREREVAFVLSRSKSKVLVIPEGYRNRNIAEEIAELLASNAGGAMSLAHVVVLGNGSDSVEVSRGATQVRNSINSGQVDVEWHRYNAISDVVMYHEHQIRKSWPCAATPEMYAQLLFTSGTSGEPKGVLHRMSTLNRASAMEINHLKLTSADRVFVPSPLAHQTGFLYGMWNAIILGVPQIVQSLWNGKRGLDAIRRWKASFVQAATPFLSDLVDAVEESGEKPGDLRIFVATGAAVPRGLAEHATRVLDAAVCGAWGTTETCLGALSAPVDEPINTWGTDGRALDGVKLRIVDNQGNVLSPSEEGQLEVNSPCMFEGYLDHPEWTSEVLSSDGWYKTGDLAVIDASGYLRMRGRIKDVINRGGEKIPVGEIEDLLYRHPLVKDIAIVAMPDARLGERACAFVVASGDIDLIEVQRYLESAKVSKHYWPERLEIIEVLPRNATGKVQKFQLRDRIREAMEKERGNSG